ncbi:hypothetical protein [Streptomyces sp. NRRL S-813]|uniref:hypothetical protein n=1 Tax=Streptomyces sp. NRRL S-813 TaxID=1463919 RepID=UPI003B63CF8C
MLRAESAVFGPVAYDPTVYRLGTAIAASGPKALASMQSARSQVREQVWELAAARSPAADGQVIVDIDGVLVLAHSEKQDATPTWKKTVDGDDALAARTHERSSSPECRDSRPQTWGSAPCGQCSPSAGESSTRSTVEASRGLWRYSPVDHEALDAVGSDPIVTQRPLQFLDPQRRT